MVDARRYLARHEAEAQHISKLLGQFGRSGETDGFWCIHGSYTHITDCVVCPDANICHNNHPPLMRGYNPDDESNYRRLLGDHMLLMLVEGRVVEDHLWLQHPETRKVNR